MLAAVGRVSSSILFILSPNQICRHITRASTVHMYYNVVIRPVTEVVGIDGDG